MEAAEVEELILKKQWNYKAFEMDINKMMGKTIMIWNK